jgi:hypothetical protein
MTFEELKEKAIVWNATFPNPPENWDSKGIVAAMAEFASEVCKEERQRMFPVLLDIYRHSTRGHMAFKIWFDREFAAELQAKRWG